MTELVGLGMSPWSEKARWALDHHRIAYRFTPYVPMLGELALRARMRRPFGRVSVPVLFDAGKVVGDSFAIARYADARGTGELLVEGPGAHDVFAWNDRSEAALDAARSIDLPRLVSTPGAGEEALPAFIPGPLRPALSRIADVGVAYVGWKYGAGTDTAGATQVVSATLVALREALGGRKYVLDRFSFADIAMAAVLQFVKPVEHPSVRIGAATREALTNEEIARSFGDLLAWRDALYGEMRRPRA